MIYRSIPSINRLSRFSAIGQSPKIPKNPSGYNAQVSKEDYFAELFDHFWLFMNRFRYSVRGRSSKGNLWGNDRCQNDVAGCYVKEKKNTQFYWINRSDDDRSWITMNLLAKDSPKTAETRAIWHLAGVRNGHLLIVGRTWYRSADTLGYRLVSVEKKKKKKSHTRTNGPCRTANGPTLVVIRDQKRRCTFIIGLTLSEKNLLLNEIYRRG